MDKSKRTLLRFAGIGLIVYAVVTDLSSSMMMLFIVGGIIGLILGSGGGG